MTAWLRLMATIPGLSNVVNVDVMASDTQSFCSLRGVLARVLASTCEPINTTQSWLTIDVSTFLLNLPLSINKLYVRPITVWYYRLIVTRKHSMQTNVRHQRSLSEGLPFQTFIRNYFSLY